MEPMLEEDEIQLREEERWDRKTWGYPLGSKASVHTLCSCESPLGFMLSLFLLTISPAGLPAEEVQQQTLQIPSLLEGPVGPAAVGREAPGEGAFPHPVHDLVFCSVFLSHLLFTSAHRHLTPALASWPSQPLSWSQPPPQLAHWLPKILMPASIALAPHPRYLPESPHSVSGLWLCPVSAHVAKHQPLPTPACSISALCQLPPDYLI